MGILFTTHMGFLLTITMGFLFTIVLGFQFTISKYIWPPVRILHETEKAILTDSGMKIWIPKSRIHGIRLKNNG